MRLSICIALACLLPGCIHIHKSPDVTSKCARFEFSESIFGGTQVTPLPVRCTHPEAVEIINSTWPYYQKGHEAK